MDDRTSPPPTPYEPPETPTERLLAGFWEELLQVEPVGRGHVFVELGGNSLLATMLANRVERALGYRPAIGEMFAGRLADLARRVDAAVREKDARQG